MTDGDAPWDDTDPEHYCVHGIFLGPGNSAGCPRCETTEFRKDVLRLLATIERRIFDLAELIATRGR